MAQQDLLTIMKQNKHKWFTTKDFINLTGLGSTSVSANLRRLRWMEEVEWEEVDCHGSLKYRWK